MILELFLTFTAVAVVMFVLGYFTGDTTNSFIGLFILFSLSFIILSGTLEYPTGNNITVVDTTTTTITNTYTGWNDTTSHIIGYAMTASTGFGMFFLFMNYRASKKKERL